MAISKDREQYKRLLVAEGIMRNPKTEHLGNKSWRKSWSSEEENLAEDVNAEPSDTDSFICLPEDIEKEKL